MLLYFMIWSLRRLLLFSAKLCLTPCNRMDWSTPGFPVLHYLLEFAQIHVSWVSENRLICCPLLLLPSIFLSIMVFSMSWLFTSGDQNIGASASVSVLPMNIQSWFPLALIGFISLLSKRLSRVFPITTILQHSAIFMVQLSHPCMTTGKTIALTRPTLIGKVMSLFYNTLSSFVMAFLPRSKCLLISWLESLQWFWSPRK